VVFLEKLGAVCEGEQLGLELFVGFGGFWVVGYWEDFCEQEFY
jgi:hypothetical protein